MKKFKLLHFIVLSILMSSCSMIKGAPSGLRKNETEYLQAQEIPRLKTPSGYQSLNYQDKYPIPQQNYPADAKRVKLTPPE